MVQTVARQKTEPRLYEVCRPIWWLGQSMPVGSVVQIDDPVVASDLCHIGRIKLAAVTAPEPAEPAESRPARSRQRQAAT